MPANDTATVDLDKLSALVETIYQAKSVDEMFRLVNRELPDLLNADRSSVSQLCVETNTLIIHAPVGLMSAQTDGIRVVDPGTYVWKSVQNNELIVFTPRPTGRGIEAMLHKAGVLSTAIVPLVFAEHRLGSINVSSLQPGRFRGDEQKALRHVAYIVTGCLIQRGLLDDANRATEAERAHREKLIILNELATDLSATASAERTYELLLSALGRVLPMVDYAGYAEFSPDMSEFTVLASCGPTIVPTGVPMEVAGSLLQEVAETGMSIYADHFDRFPNDRARLMREAGFTNGWCVPVNPEESLRGVIFIASSESLREIDEGLTVLSTIGNLMSVTIERLEAQAKAAAALQTFVDNSPVLIVAVGHDGTIQRFSRFGAQSLGFSVDDLLGRNFCDLHPKSQQFDAERRLYEWSSQSTDTVTAYEVMMQRGTGEHQWTRQSARAVTDEHGEQIILIACEDIAAVRKLTDELHHQVRHDSLTNLANRSHFEDRLNSALTDAAHSGEQFAVIFIDIDHFKAVNDRHGHAAGDELLCAVAGRISDTVRASDLVARVGGDEFQIILRHLSSLSDAQIVAEKLRAAVNAPMELEAVTLTVGASFGIAYGEGGKISPDELVKRADIALYRAKELGRNNVQLFTGAMSSRLSRRSVMEQELIRAIEGNEFRLQFQPRFRASDGVMEAVEALVRWQHPEQGWLSPDRFIPLAEECGLIGRLTTWVLSEGLRELARLNEQWPSIHLGVNVSARELIVNGDLVERVISELKHRNLEPHCLELEITETAFCEDLEAGRQVLMSLVDVGVHLALDDFGTGYASLSQLVALPIDTLKIDRSFVMALDSDKRARSITDTVAQLSSNLNIQCVAEGVETAWQAAYLQNIGVDSLQGYLFARPLDMDDLIGKIADLQAQAQQILVESSGVRLDHDADPGQSH